MASNLNGTFNSVLKLFWLSTRTFSRILWYLLQSFPLCRSLYRPSDYSCIFCFPKRTGNIITNASDSCYLMYEHPWIPQTLFLFSFHGRFPFPTNRYCFHLQYIFCFCEIVIIRCSHQPIFQISFFLNSLLSTFKILMFLWFSRNFYTTHTFKYMSFFCFFLLSHLPSE